MPRQYLSRDRTNAIALAMEDARAAGKGLTLVEPGVEYAARLAGGAELARCARPYAAVCDARAHAAARGEAVAVWRLDPAGHATLFAVAAPDGTGGAVTDWR